MRAEDMLATADEVIADRTGQVDYARLVDEEIEEYNNIELTKDLREGGIHAQEPWRAWFEFLTSYVFGRSLVEEAVAFCQLLRHPARVISLGCGYGGMEIDIARMLRSRSVEFEMLAVDLNAHLFGGCREVARSEQLPIDFRECDLNFVAFQPDSFDLVFAHASLHHLLNLEHVFAQIHRGLRSGGRLILLDMIGEVQTLFWRENVEWIRTVVEAMPDRFKRGQSARELIPEYIPPDKQLGMEGIRQEEILEQLLPFFEVVVLHRYGSMMRMICTHPILGKAFDLGRSEDRTYLENLFRLDLELVRTGALKPTEMMAVFDRRQVPLRRAE